VQESQDGVKFSGTHCILIYANAVNLLGKNTDTVQQNTKAVIDVSKEAGLEANTIKLYARISQPRREDRIVI
jgi:hypothetical protein